MNNEGCDIEDGGAIYSSLREDGGGDTIADHGIDIVFDDETLHRLLQVLEGGGFKALGIGGLPAIDSLDRLRNHQKAKWTASGGEIGMAIKGIRFNLLPPLGELQFIGCVTTDEGPIGSEEAP